MIISYEVLEQAAIGISAALEADDGVFSKAARDSVYITARSEGMVEEVGGWRWEWDGMEEALAVKAP